jgi:hypothetical protein
MDYYQLNNMVTSVLKPDEKLLWYGQPNPKRVMFRLESLAIFIFSIPWTAFSLFWVCAAAGFRIPDFSKPSFFMFFPLFGVPFVLVGLGMMATPYWKYRQAQSTFYVITDKRCLTVVNTLRSKKIEVALPQDMGNLNITERPDGTGDLVFSQEKYTTSKGNRIRPIGFWGIPQVRNVEQIMEDTFISKKNNHD